MTLLWEGGAVLSSFLLPTWWRREGGNRWVATFVFEGKERKEEGREGRNEKGTGPDTGAQFFRFLRSSLFCFFTLVLWGEKIKKKWSREIHFLFKAC